MKKLHELFHEYVLSGESWGESRVVAVHTFLESTSNQNVWRWMTRKASEYILHIGIYYVTQPLTSNPKPWNPILRPVDLPYIIPLQALIRLYEDEKLVNSLIEEKDR